MTDPDKTIRPRQLCQLLLGADPGRPRQRARDQRADVAGGDLKRRVLERIVEWDPDPDDLSRALESIILDLGEPTGPTRAIARDIAAELAAMNQNHRLVEWLVDQARKVVLTAPRDDTSSDRRSPHRSA